MAHTRTVLTCIAVTCLFLAAIFFAPYLAREARTQMNNPSMIVYDDEGLPVSHPSRLLGTKLPLKVDLRKELPQVADQGDIFSQSCVTFATVYYQMTQYVKHFKHPEWDLKNPEHQFSVAFPLIWGAKGHPTYVYAPLKDYGCVDAAEMQYDMDGGVIQPTDKQLEAAKPYRISGYVPLWDHGNEKPPYDPPDSIQNAKAWLADGHVLSVTIDPNAPGFPDGSSDCAPPTKFYDVVESDHEYSPGHGVAICGYNDNINPRGKDPDHRGGFLLVNSHGPRWNGDMRGFIWLSYAYFKRYIQYCYVMTMDDASDAPVITGCSFLAEGSSGVKILISGRNFGAYRRLAGVTFGGVRAEKIISWTNEGVVVTTDKMCPKSGPSGPIVLHNWEGAASNSFPFEF